jgi:hypothetical protein
MSMIQRNRGIGRRNAPLATLLLALPLALLVRCTGPTDQTIDDPNGPHVPDAIPVVQCTSVDQCELPRSTCSGSSLAYYSNARCQAGYCAWDQMTTECGAGGCFNGGCNSGTMTAVSAPPLHPCGGASASNIGACTGSGGSGGSGGDDDGGGACNPDDDGGPSQCVP